MAIKKVTYFETSNGLTFQNEAEAIEAEKTYQIRETLISLLYSADFTDKDSYRIADFIANNRKTISEILNKNDFK